MKNTILKNQSAAARKHQPAKWNLTAAAFGGFLSRLDINREKAGEKYVTLRRNLVRFFEGRGFSEAEEAADEVCNRLARKLDAGEHIEDLNQYAYGVARYLILELYKEQARRRQIAEKLSIDEFSQEEENESELRLDCLNRCLGDLSAENRELILAYYQGDGREKIENRRKLAEKMGIPNNALRNRAVRLREKLKILVVRNLRKQTI